MKKFVLLFAVFYCALTSQSTLAQVYMETKSQHRFAQTYVGMNTQIVPASGSVVWQQQTHAFPMQWIPRFSIGGLHFWGKLDFNMNVPLTSLGSNTLSGGGELDFSTGADLSVRYYPWRLQYGKLRPYGGLSFNAMSLALGNKEVGERVDGFITSSLLAGLAYARNGWQLSAEIMFMPQNKRDFYSDLQQKHRITLPQSYMSLGISRYFDFTLKEEAPKLSGETKALEKKILKDGSLNSFSLGIAPNGSWFLQSPGFEGALASLPRHKGSFNWEFAAGYLFSKARIHTGLTYRTYNARSVSYQLEHIVRREALSLEVFHFLLDYNGFVPFLGLSLSAERWASGLFEEDVQQGETVRTQLFSPGIIFGWDILASPLETWVLRTNLRYYPFQEINDINDTQSRVDQFEFNFIQLVIYPNRMVKIKRAKSGQ
jgi:hypothetical protein